MYSTRCASRIFPHSYRADGEPLDTLLHSIHSHTIYWIKRLLHLLGSITICVGSSVFDAAHTMEIPKYIFSVISLLLANLLSNLFILAYVKVYTKYSDPKISPFRSVGFSYMPISFRHFFFARNVNIIVVAVDLISVQVAFSILLPLDCIFHDRTLLILYKYCCCRYYLVLAPIKAVRITKTAMAMVRW